jgi:hypothetical protein
VSGEFALHSLCRVTIKPYSANSAAHTEAAKHVEEKRRFFVVLTTFYMAMVKWRLIAN